MFSAPSGYGKSWAANRIANASSGLVVWCRLSDVDVDDGGTSAMLGSLVDAFPHLGSQPRVADTTGAARLEYALGDLAGPASIIIDDLHLLAGNDAQLLGPLLDRTGDDFRIIVTTRAAPPAMFLHGVANGSVVLLGARDLLLDTADCAQLSRSAGSALTGDEIWRQSGGWPLAAAALARSGEVVGAALAAQALAELSLVARDSLRALATLSSVPRAAIGDEPADLELDQFAHRHPGMIEVDDDRWTIRELIRSTLLESAASADAMTKLADRLDRIGAARSALILLSRLDGNLSLLQDRLVAEGPRWLDTGQFAFLRTVITQIPESERRLTTLQLDAFAALSLDQIEQRAEPGFRINEDVLDTLAAHRGSTEDDDLIIAGLRTEFLRRRGDPRLVEVAMGALDIIGGVGPDASARDLIAERVPLARRATFHIVHGLGTAALYSGDHATVIEGQRLQELAFDVAEQAGIDTVPHRAQSSYERVAMGIDAVGSAIAPLQAGSTALRAIGHPEAANQLIQLAELHARRGDVRAARSAIDAAADWAERTGNELVLPSIALVQAGVDLLDDGPSESNDRNLDLAWDSLTAGTRLRRAAPAFAVQIANMFLDQDDTLRAGLWLDRARALVGGQVQRGYQQEFINSVVERLRFLSGAANQDLTSPWVRDPANRFSAQPAGAFEARATTAWDLLRRGTPGAAQRLITEFSGELPSPWQSRLGALPPEPRSPAGLRIRLLCPELRVEQDGHPVAGPTGHAARLLARLVLADGVMTLDAALDDLWPDADPVAARNRFHQVLLRLRRALGSATAGSITISGGLVRLDAAEMTTDVWDLRSVDPANGPSARALIDAYESDLCSAQFAYDDVFADARWELSQRLVTLVSALLAGARARDDSVRQSAWSVWNRMSDDDRIGELLADALDRIGDTVGASDIRRRIIKHTGAT